MNNVLQYEVVPAGWFEDGAPAFKLINTEEFMLHGVTVPAGAIGEFRMDEDSEFVSSWIFHKADIRNSSIRHTIVQESKRPLLVGNPVSLFKDCNIRSCLFTGNQVVVRNAELNAVWASARLLGVFIAVGTPEENIVFNKTKFHKTVRCWSGSVDEAKAFSRKISL